MTPDRPLKPRAAADPPWVRALLIALALSAMTGLIIVPVLHVFWLALSEGVGAYGNNLAGDPETRHAILLTLLVAPLAVIANLLFGLAAAWCVARFRFRGRALLLALIDVPFSVSPVVVGLMFVLLFGLRGYFGPFFERIGVPVVFAKPGLVLVTMFVTMPLVARELIPVMEALGPEEELAALSLGANGWQIFTRVTLPNVQWAVIYGAILCNARAMGEFGAVYVVGGKVAGATDTMPLRVEKLLMEYNTPGSFAVASVLTLLAACTLLLKVLIERQLRKQLKAARLDAASVSPGGGDA